MTLSQIQNKIQKIQKTLNKKRKLNDWFVEESDLVHDLELLQSIETKLERIEQELKLLKTI